jgi:hypothetical protein
VSDAIICKAFNDAVGGNESQAQTNLQKTKPPGEMAALYLINLAVFECCREL